MSAKSKRGRPVKDVNKVNINDLVVELLATKENDYNANICYFKVVDVECKTKMKVLSVYKMMIFVCHFGKQLTNKK